MSLAQNWAVVIQGAVHIFVINWIDSTTTDVSNRVKAVLCIVRPVFHIGSVLSIHLNDTLTVIIRGGCGLIVEYQAARSQLCRCTARLKLNLLLFSLFLSTLTHTLYWSWQYQIFWNRHHFLRDTSIYTSSRCFLSLWYCLSSSHFVICL